MGTPVTRKSCIQSSLVRILGVCEEVEAGGNKCARRRSSRCSRRNSFNSRVTLASKACSVRPNLWRTNRCGFGRSWLAGRSLWASSGERFEGCGRVRVTRSVRGKPGTPRAVGVAGSGIVVRTVAPALWLSQGRRSGAMGGDSSLSPGSEAKGRESPRLERGPNQHFIFGRLLRGISVRSGWFSSSGSAALPLSNAGL